MIQVIKRDGERAEFRLVKITEAIKKAFKAILMWQRLTFFTASSVRKSAI